MSSITSIAIRLIIVLAGLVLASCASSVDTSAQKISVEATRLVVNGSNGARLSSDELVGIELDLGLQRRARIDAVERDTQSIGEVWLYRLSARQPSGRWENICTPDKDGQRLALLLPGFFDVHNHFIGDRQRLTLACTSGAQGKCVRLGYRPWERNSKGRSLAPTYDACVRMMRADYCGDGRSFTRDGTPIQIWNGSHKRLDTGDPAFAFEAAWSQDGAICVAHPRVREEISLAALATTCPGLRRHLGARSCTPDVRGALLLNSSRVGGQASPIPVDPSGLNRIGAVH